MAVPRTWANGTNVIPILGTVEILRPEGPAPTLLRASFIHGATLSSVPENAVVVRLLDQTVPPTHLSNKSAGKSLDRLTSIIGDPGNLLRSDPHIARCSRTASTASGAGKLQAIAIPRGVVRLTHVRPRERENPSCGHPCFCKELSNVRVASQPREPNPNSIRRFRQPDPSSSWIEQTVRSSLVNLCRVIMMNCQEVPVTNARSLCPRSLD